MAVTGAEIAFCVRCRVFFMGGGASFSGYPFRRRKSMDVSAPVGRLARRSVVFCRIINAGRFLTATGRRSQIRVFATYAQNSKIKLIYEIVGCMTHSDK